MCISPRPSAALTDERHLDLDLVGVLLDLRVLVDEQGDLAARSPSTFNAAETLRANPQHCEPPGAASVLTTRPTPLAAAMALTIETVVLPSEMQSRPYCNDGYALATLAGASGSLSVEAAREVRDCLSMPQRVVEEREGGSASEGSQSKTAAAPNFLTRSKFFGLETEMGV